MIVDINDFSANTYLDHQQYRNSLLRIDSDGFNFLK